MPSIAVSLYCTLFICVSRHFWRGWKGWRGSTDGLTLNKIGLDSWRKSKRGMDSKTPWTVDKRPREGPVVVPWNLKYFSPMLRG